MSDIKSQAINRLNSIKNALTMSKPATTIPWDPNSNVFPTRADVPKPAGAPDDAAWVWGKDDQRGRINLLTPSRVLQASKSIRTGEVVTVNLPLQHPSPPSFGREPFKHELKPLMPDVANDDLYTLNTQSGTQWDGFRHVAHMKSKVFYNGATSSDFYGADANLKCSMHYLAEHGIAGRGVLLDVFGYAKKIGKEYNPWDHFAFSMDLLVATGKDQGIDIRPAAQGGDIQPGDLLFIRGGWAQKYWSASAEERTAVASRSHRDIKWAGVEQSTEMIDWLHDTYFATVAGDAPAFEAWPTPKDWSLHEYLLAMWGVPIGEMLDLERLAEKCNERKRWFFFFSSVPNNCEGGVGSHVNGQAIF